MNPYVEGDDNDDVCGEAYDHDTFVTYEDVDGIQWMCRKCGAEGWEEEND